MSFAKLEDDLWYQIFSFLKNPLPAPYAILSVAEERKARSLARQDDLATLMRTSSVSAVGEL